MVVRRVRPVHLRAGILAAVEELVGDAPSAYRLILPEAFLDSSDVEARIGSICKTMQNYIDDGVFAEYKDAYVYVERTMRGGGVRRDWSAVSTLKNTTIPPNRARLCARPRALCCRAFRRACGYAKMRRLSSRTSWC